MDAKELEAIKERCEAATPGPLQVVSRGGTIMGFDINLVDWETRGDLPSGIRGMFGREEDATFYAHARTDLPWCINQIEYLHGLIEGLLSGTISPEQARHALQRPAGAQRTLPALAGTEPREVARD